MTARLTVLSGPSGVGKGTVVAHLRQHHPQVWLSVSVTTRRARPEETDGIEYRFVSPAEFETLVEAGALLEHATYAGHRYGTPRAAVEERLRAGRPALLEIDVQGACQVRKAMPDALLVFLAPPSAAELERRLIGRGTETLEVIRERLHRARAELAAEAEFDETIVNSTVPEAAQRLVTLMTI